MQHKSLFTVPQTWVLHRYTGKQPCMVTSLLPARDDLCSLVSLCFLTTFYNQWSHIIARIFIVLVVWAITVRELKQYTIHLIWFSRAIFDLFLNAFINLKSNIWRQQYKQKIDDNYASNLHIKFKINKLWQTKVKSSLSKPYVDYLKYI